LGVILTLPERTYPSFEGIFFSLAVFFIKKQHWRNAMLEYRGDRRNPYKLYKIMDGPACIVPDGLFSHTAYRLAYRFAGQSCPRQEGQGQGLCVTNDCNFICFYAETMEEAEDYIAAK
jgi:hypothetical protein